MNGCVVIAKQLVSC